MPKETKTLVKVKHRNGTEGWVEKKDTKGPYNVLEDEAIRQKFLAAKGVGATNEAAATWAGISLSAYDKYAADNEEFREECRLAAERPNMVARQTLVALMNDEDPKIRLDSTKFYLKNRLSSEYHEVSKKEIQTTNIKAIVSMGDAKFLDMAGNSLKQIMENNNVHRTGEDEETLGIGFSDSSA